MAVSAKPLRWLGSSLEDVRCFPTEVRRDIGYALFAAQRGQMDPSVKPLKGFGGAGVLEVVSNSRGDTWSAVYTVRFAEAIYVLLAFQKKSKSGIGTPTRIIELVKRRLKDAETDYRRRQN